MASRGAPDIRSTARRPSSTCRARCATASRGGSRCAARTGDLRRCGSEIDNLEPATARTRRAGGCAKASWHARQRSRRIPYIDPVDVRYAGSRTSPAGAEAVMFCLMDVSGSMTEHMKDLAKRFFMLLYLFLSRRYRHVDIVFIRHTHRRARWTRKPSSTRRDRRHGGLHGARGDAAGSAERYPRERVEHLRGAGVGRRQHAERQRRSRCGPANERILPICQYFAYLEVGRESDGRHGFAPRDRAVARLSADAQAGQPLAMRKVSHRRDIYPVFRELFAKQPTGGGRPRATLMPTACQRAPTGISTARPSTTRSRQSPRATRPRHLPQSGRGDHAPSRCSMPIRRSACR